MSSAYPPQAGYFDLLLQLGLIRDAYRLARGGKPSWPVSYLVLTWLLRLLFLWNGMSDYATVLFSNPPFMGWFFILDFLFPSPLATVSAVQVWWLENWPQIEIWLLERCSQAERWSRPSSSLSQSQSRNRVGRTIASNGTGGGPPPARRVFAADVSLWNAVNGSNLSPDSQCPICLDDYSASHEAVRSPCGHLFGRRCIERSLLRTNNSCPSCRATLIQSAEELEILRYRIQQYDLHEAQERSLQEFLTAKQRSIFSTRNAITCIRFGTGPISATLIHQARAEAGARGVPYDVYDDVEVIIEELEKIRPPIRTGQANNWLTWEWLKELEMLDSSFARAVPDPEVFYDLRQARQRRVLTRLDGF